MKNKIRKLLEKYNVSPEKVIIGIGETYNTRKYFEFDLRNRKETVDETASYAVKFFYKHNLVLVWDIKTVQNLKRTKLTLKAETAFGRIEKSSAVKSVEFSGLDKEKVFIYPADEIEKAIIRIKECLK